MRTILVTGATAGLGRALAIDLAARHRVIVHGRNPETAARAANDILERNPDASVWTVSADLADLGAVARLADEVMTLPIRPDVIVHNAAVGSGPEPTRRDVSVDGHELRFAVNHLAPHLLTRLLAPHLASGSRIVNVASIGQAAIVFDDLMFTRGFEAIEAYCRSKLAMIMSTFDLADRLAGAGITVNAVHPAHLMDTPMVRSASGFAVETDVAEGVAPVSRLAWHPDVAKTSGVYFDQFTPTRAHEQAYDADARRLLSTVTEELIAPWIGALQR